MATRLRACLIPRDDIRAKEARRWGEACGSCAVWGEEAALRPAQVREYSKAEEAEQAEGAAGQEGLRNEANKKRRQLEQWSASAYGEVLLG